MERRTMGAHGLKEEKPMGVPTEITKERGMELTAILSGESLGRAEQNEYETSAEKSKRR